MLKELNRVTYDFSVEGRILPPKRQESKTGVSVFLKVLDRAESLECLAEESDEGSVRRVELFSVNTGASAVLNINYGGDRGYTAKVLMEKNEVQQELAVDSVDSAEKKLVKVLTDPSYHLEKKKRKTTSLNLRAIQDEDEAYLEGKFRT